MAARSARRNQREMQFLKQVGILSGLSEEELEHVFEISHRVEVDAGTVIMREGEPGDSMFFFAEGEVNVSKTLTMKVGAKGFSSAEKSFVTLKSDKVSFFGDMAMFETEPRSASITAGTDCVLYEIRREDFTNLCDQYPVLGVRILRQMAVTLCQRIRRGNEDVLKLSTALSIALTK